jgi:hypothetical protein
MRRLFGIIAEKKMRIALLLMASATLGAFPAQGQMRNPAQNTFQTPSVGQIEIRAYQAIPKTKVAVQLTSDTSLSRNLRREVMIQLAKRGNDVGFHGGNVMRMDVSYFDLSSGGGGGTNNSDFTPSYDSPGSNPKPEMEGRLPFRQNGPYADKQLPVASTLRIVLTLYTVDSGKVLWAASASCNTEATRALQAGEAMIDNIFRDADKNRVADAGCPL